MEEKFYKILKEDESINNSLMTKYVKHDEFALKECQNNHEMPSTPKDFMICCDCTDGCITAECACKKACWDDNKLKQINRKQTKLKKFDDRRARKFPYDNGLLLNEIKPASEKGDYGTAVLIECNKHCKCQLARSKHRCTNHVVQDGQKTNIEIFLTKKKGWGVRAVEDIRKGSFIGVYQGTD